MEFSGKVALITGSAQGIGRATAIELAKEGSSLILMDVNYEGLEKVKSELAEYGTDVMIFECNISDEAKVYACIDEAKAHFGKIDILVNNAGQTKDGLMMRMSEEQWDSIIATNLKSSFNFTHAVVPAMARRRAGSIINISSVVGVNGNAGQCNYSASKAAMIGLTKSIAKEMGARGIRANAIAPGFIVTDMTDKLSDDMRAKVTETIPLRRGGKPEEVADVALFLASELSSYVSGQTIHCCGAMSC